MDQQHWQPAPTLSQRVSVAGSYVWTLQWEMTAQLMIDAVMMAIQTSTESRFAYAFNAAMESFFSRL